MLQITFKSSLNLFFSFLQLNKGRRQNSSVAFGDFLQRMTNVGW